LGWTYRPLEETLVDSVESYRKAKLVDWKLGKKSKIVF